MTTLLGLFIGATIAVLALAFFHPLLFVVILWIGEAGNHFWAWAFEKAFPTPPRTPRVHADGNDPACALYPNCEKGVCHDR